eukprot:scaffold60075_cov31-Tisochrysis_lutea.AAC.5
MHCTRRQNKSRQELRACVAADKIYERSRPHSLITRDDQLAATAGRTRHGARHLRSVHAVVRALAKVVANKERQAVSELTQLCSGQAQGGLIFRQGEHLRGGLHRTRKIGGGHVAQPMPAVLVVTR